MSKKLILILISGLSILVTIIDGVFVVNFIKGRLNESLISQYIEQENLIAEETTNLLQSEILSFQDKLISISHDPLIKNPVNTDSCNKELTTVSQSLHNKPNNIGRVDINGKFICSLNPVLIGSDANKLGPYISEIFNDPQHKPVMGRAIKIPGVDGYAIAIHIPVYDSNNNFNGTLGGAIYFNDLKENFLKNIVFNSDGYITLTDDNYDILYHPQNSFIGKNINSAEIRNAAGNNPDILTKSTNAINGERGYLQYKFNNIEKIGVFYPVNIFPNRHWIISVTVPLESIQNTILNTKITRYFIFIGLIFILAICLPPLIILIFLNFSIFRPLKKLNVYMENMSHGNFDEKIKYKSKNKNDEISNLLLSFEDMRSELKDLYLNLNKKVDENTAQIRIERDSLEKKVQERTLELNDAKNHLEQEVEKQTSKLRESLDEVQKINDAMVNRELKMLELKNRIKELEDKLKQINE